VKKAALLLALAVFASAASPALAEKPNILVILSDDKY
jgi:hypothetical protein